MFYKRLLFPTLKTRPFFYSNFVATIDGKVTAGPGYWPIGSEKDHQVLIELRAYADVLIHGKNTANKFKTLDSLAKLEFKKMRKKLGKPEILPYLIISNSPDDSLIPYLKSQENQPILATSQQARLSKELEKQVQLIRIGENRVDLKKLAVYLQKQGFKNTLLEGGPTLMGSFLEADLIDEIFLTLAPKIFGSGKFTLTMVENCLLPPQQVKNWQLLSVKRFADELFLRYSSRHK